MYEPCHSHKNFIQKTVVGQNKVHIFMAPKRQAHNKTCEEIKGMLLKNYLIQKHNTNWWKGMQKILPNHKKKLQKSSVVDVKVCTKVVTTKFAFFTHKNWCQGMILVLPKKIALCTKNVHKSVWFCTKKVPSSVLTEKNTLVRVW